MSYFLITLTLITITSSFTLSQSEKGNEVICRFNTGHVLERQKDPNRKLTNDVKFTSPFPVAPQIFITPQLLDWGTGLPVGFSIQATDISTTGFKLSAIALNDVPLFQIFIDWIAIYDPRVAVLTYESSDLDQLANGQDDRKVQFTLKHDLPLVKNALIAINGCRHLKTNQIVEIKIAQISDTFVNVIVRTYWIAQVNFIRFNVLLGTEDALLTYPTVLFYNSPSSSHPFVRRGDSETEVVYKYDLPEKWQKVGKIFQPTLVGYDAEHQRNFRLYIKNAGIENNQVTYAIATWSDTQIYGFYHQSGVYNSDPYKIFDPKCAELFAECDFKGESLKICDKNNDISNGGWTKPIKSIHIPPGKQLYLYDQQNLQGKKIQYTSSQSCINSYTFSFAQLKNEEQKVLIGN